MNLSDYDIEVILGHVQEAVWIQADADGWSEDDGVEASQELCEEVRMVLSREIEPPHPY